MFCNFVYGLVEGGMFFFDNLFRFIWELVEIEGEVYFGLEVVKEFVLGNVCEFGCGIDGEVNDIVL